jgi:tRNA(Ile)-lysidine synthase
LTAVSGGSDSTALWVALARLRAELGLDELVLAHLDHGLRADDEAAADRAFVEGLAARFDLPLAVERADARAELAARGTGSLEAAARALRYRFFTRLARERDADRVAVAHTRDDQVETVLMRVLRGTGLRGLGGIPRSRRLSAEAPHTRVVRPLLGVGRQEARAYLSELGIAWREDPSNDDRRFLRNRLRHDVLPLLGEVANPQVDQALVRLAGQARRASAHLRRAAAELLAEARHGEAWRLEPLRRADVAVRREALARIVAADAPARAATCHVEALERLVGAGQGSASLPEGRVLEARDGLLAAPREAVEVPVLAPLDLPVPGAVADPAAGLVFRTRRLTRGADQCGDALHTDPTRLALLDADRLRGTLAIRRRRSGDRFWPLGAPGSRALKRFLIDRKVPRFLRAAVPVVTLDDQPVWVVGHRIDERYKVTPATREVLEIRALTSGAE